MNLFAVKDVKTGGFISPNLQRSIPDALRSWEIESNNPESMISKFPNDFRLYHFGEFDNMNGILKVLEHPADLGSAADFKTKNTN